MNAHRFDAYSSASMMNKQKLHKHYDNTRS